MANVTLLTGTKNPTEREGECVSDNAKDELESRKNERSTIKKCTENVFDVSEKVENRKDGIFVGILLSNSIQMML